MTTAEERLKVAIEVLGDHAWVRTWIAHQAVEKLLDALVEARVRDVDASPRNEVFDPPLFTPGPAAVYDQAVHVASLSLRYFVSQRGQDARNALNGMVEAVASLFATLSDAEREAICDEAVELCCGGKAPIDKHDATLAARTATLHVLARLREVR